MSLFDFFSLYRTNPITLRNHHNSSFTEDILNRQHEMIQHWYKQFLPHAYRFINKVAVDIIENDFLFRVVADLSGTSADDFNINITGHDITILATKKPVSIDDGDHYVLQERQTGLLQRTIHLPDEADIDNATAKFSNGLLIIDIPKRNEANGSRKLTILEMHEPTNVLPTKAVA